MDGKLDGYDGRREQKVGSEGMGRKLRKRWTGRKVSKV